MGHFDICTKTFQHGWKETAQAFAVEVLDEVCSDSEYGARVPPDDTEAKPKSVEVKKHHPKPPPAREKTIGGVKYYTVTYEDYSDEDDVNY